MANLQAHVVNRLSPRNWAILATTPITASAAAWWARSSSSGPAIASWPLRRRASPRATRSRSSWSRATASSYDAPLPASARTHAPDSGSNAASPAGDSGAVGSADATAPILAEDLGRPSSASELMPAIEDLPVSRHLDGVQGSAVRQPEQEVRPGAPNRGIGLGLLGEGRALGAEVDPPRRRPVGGVQVESAA